jgi:DNA-3-methyladenine glycosylase II
MRQATCLAFQAAFLFRMLAIRSEVLREGFWQRGLAEARSGLMTIKQSDIRKARRHLRVVDPVMKSIIDAVGPFTLGLDRDRFRMLVCSIISQQISGNAAASIFARLRKMAGPEGLNAANLAKFSIAELRSVGLSPQKAGYVADLTRKVKDGTVNLRQIGRLSDEQVVERLVQVKGIGRWTAQMFLIFSLGRLDVFPHDDLGVRSAIRNNYGLDDLPDKTTALAIAEPWRPYASVASWYCWQWLDLE